MAPTIQADPVPLRADADGVLRVGETRVLFELVVRAFDDGATPEAIVQRYPSLGLADTYAAVTYYLRHREEVAAYLRRRDAAAAEVRQRLEAAQPGLAELRSRLSERKGTGA